MLLIFKCLRILETQGDSILKSNPLKRKPLTGKSLTILGVLMLCFCMTNTVSAEIYKWVDSDGNVYFTGKKPTTQQSKQVEVKTNTYTAGSSTNGTGVKVVMYATKRCPYCKQARQYFRKNGIRFTEYDVENDYRAMQRYKKMGATGVPVIFVGKTRINGFNVARFKQVYKLSQLPSTVKKP